MPFQGFIPCLICYAMSLRWGLMVPVCAQHHHPACRLSERTALCDRSQLVSVPMDLPENIEELQISNNNIRILPNTCLSGYPELRTLNVANNSLTAAEPNLFYNSRRVENLNLAENNLMAGHVQTGEALRLLHQLKVLDLSRNGLCEDMVSSLLQNMTSLERLFLSGNVLQRLDQTTFRDLHHLRELNLDRNVLFEIEEGSFDNLQRLQVLSMAFNQIACLINFRLTQLVVLNVSHNAIEWFVSDQDMKEIFHLETLDLRDNSLFFFPFLPTHSRLQNLLLSSNKVRFYQHLADSNAQNWTTSIQFFNLNSNISNVTTELWEENLHGDISSLDVLDLSVNQLTYIPQAFLSKTPNLSRLRLGTNCLESLNLTLEELPASLYELDVSNNKLAVLHTNQAYLNMLANLTHLNLSLNKLQRLPQKLFSSLPSLAVVDLSYNKLGICSSQEVNAEAEDSGCVLWRNISSLRRLYLQGCDLEFLPPLAFEGTPLTHLELSDNTQIVVREWSLTSLSRTLKHLGLGNTNVQDLDFGCFDLLRSLDISRNSLSVLPNSMLKLSLMWLDLRGNRLKTIPGPEAQMLSQSLQTLFLGGNPFNCCQSDWFRTFIETSTLSVEDQSDVTCLTSAHREQTLDLETVRLCGNSDEEQNWLYVLLFLPMCLSLIGIAVIFLLTFRLKQLPKKIKWRCWRPTSY